MSNREHLVAVIDTTPEAEATLDLAHQTVARGGRATLVILLSPQDWRHIRSFAEAENLAIGEAEAMYIDRTTEAYVARVGGTDTNTIVRQSPSSGRAVLEAAARANATAVAVPTFMAGQRSWRNALSRTPIPVVVTPSRAA